MEEQRPGMTPDGDLTPTSEGSHGELHRRAHDLLAAQCSQIDRLEADLSEQLQRLAEEVSRELTQKTGEVAAAASQDTQRLAAFQDELERKNQQFAQLQAKFDQAQKQVEPLQAKIALLEQALHDRDAQITHSQQQLTQLESSSTENLAQVDQRAAKAEAETAQTRRQLDEARRKATELESQLSELNESLKKAHAAGVDHGELQKTLEALRKERDELAQHLADAKAKLDEASNSNPDPAADSDMQRRYEMVLEDLKEMKLAKAELEEKMEKMRKSGVSAATPSGGLDWEAQKQRLLASLEADERHGEEAESERNTIEGTIQITDRIVEQKDQEITELRRLLEEQSNNLGSMAVGAAAVADLLDRDELIQQERKKLQQVEAEWREKIGKAEIAISLERAKIAREQAQLEEKLRQYQSDNASRSHDQKPNEPSKPVRGRWLSKLGLKDLDDPK